MRVAIFLATFFVAGVSASASTSSIISPDHHQSFAYGAMISHQLYPGRARGELAARITFSNWLMTMTAIHAGMNRSISVFRVSGSIQRDAHFL
jgi:hypothetical protein